MNILKYSCQGNDFLLFDLLTHKDVELSFSARQVQFLCDRKMGMGADGILLLRPSPTSDFRMVYYNADGNEVEMCGNGARACVHAYSVAQKKSPETQVEFETMNGLYSGCVHENGDVSVSMNEVGDIDPERVKDLNRDMKAKNSFFIQVGVPHVLFEVEDAQNYDLEKMAPLVRHDPRFKEGTNVSIFTFTSKEDIQMRTFERGVEGETLACGTAASALACVAQKSYKRELPQNIHVPGGVLKIELKNQRYQLRAPVFEVFQAKLSATSQARLFELD